MDIHRCPRCRTIKDFSKAVQVGNKYVCRDCFNKPIEDTAMNKLFDVENERDTEYLHGVIDALVEANASDAQVIERLQDIYDPSCWFSVFSFTEQVIYG